MTTSIKDRRDLSLHSYLCQTRFIFSSSGSDGEEIGEFDLIDQGFKMAPFPPHNAPSRPETCSSSRSSEFQTVLDGFTALKLQETKAEGIEPKKSIDPNEDKERLLHKRRNSTELTPIDIVNEFGQQSHRARRASPPSLGLVAVDIQYSIPLQRHSGSYPENLANGIGKYELGIIKEIPEKGRGHSNKPSHLKAATNKTSSSCQLGGNSNLFRRRRFSLGAQRNTNVANTAFGLPTKQRRVSCSSRVESNSAWRVKVHQRSLGINDDFDNLDPHNIQPARGNHPLYKRRNSLSSISSFSGEPVSTKYNILPKIGQKNSLVGKPDIE